MDQIDSASIHRALSQAHSYTIQTELVSQLARPRIPELGASSSLDPVEALKTYLDNREDLKDISAHMLEAAHKLLAVEAEVWLDTSSNEEQAQRGLERQSQLSIENTEGQLRLL